MTLRSSDLQSDSDLDSIRNSCAMITCVLLFTLLTLYGAVCKEEEEVTDEVVYDMKNVVKLVDE